jgi:hypothetical protein
MDTISQLPKSTLAKAYNYLIDIELARMCGSTQEYIQQIHDKFYILIPHKNNPIMTETQIYRVKARLITEIKDIKT